MNQTKASLAEQLKGFSAVNVKPSDAVCALEQFLYRYGPVDRSKFTDFDGALDYLLPLKSFTTRYLVIGVNRWSIILTDMRGEACYVDAYAISRATLCNGIGIIIKDECRELHLYEEGKPVRKVQSLLDGDRWYYREEGPLQPFEDCDECLRRKKRDRLRVAALRRYFETYTGLTIPNWKSGKFDEFLGLERCLKDIQIPVKAYETARDL